MKRGLLVGVVSLTILSGCAGVSPVQMGQTAGTILGAAIAPGAGAPLGSLVGLLAGMVIQGEVDKVTEKHERKTLSDELGASPTQIGKGPEATPPQGEPTRVWVDESMKDGRLIAGHFDTRDILN